MRTRIRTHASFALLVSTLAAARADTPSAQQTAVDRHVIALRQMMETVSAGDSAGYARLYSLDAVITIYGGAVITSRNAIEQYEANLIRELPGTRLAFYSAWHQAPLAVVHYGVNGRTTGGRQMGHEGLLFFRFDDAGKIVEERRYLDSLTPMTQVGALSGRSRPLPVLPATMKVAASTGSADEARNVAVVRRVLASIESNDPASFRSVAAPGITVNELMLIEPFVGVTNASRWFEMWSGAVRNPRLEVTTILGVEDYVLAEIVIRGTLSGTLGRLAPSATPFTAHRAIATRLSNGRIVELTSFMNAREIAESTGQWPLR